MVVACFAENHYYNIPPAYLWFLIIINPKAGVKWVCHACQSFEWVFGWVSGGFGGEVGLPRLPEFSMGFWVGFRWVCVGFATSARVFNGFLGGFQVGLCGLRVEFYKHFGSFWAYCRIYFSVEEGRKRRGGGKKV